MTPAPLAIVEFPADRRNVIHLTADAGWRLPDASGPAPAAFERLLDTMADPDRYGPADGDPVACAAAAAAELLGGTVTYVRPPDPVPHGSVY